MFLRSSPLSVLLFVAFGCSGPGTAVTLTDLDFVQIADQAGWVLRVYGDGAGSLRHRQLPAHHLHYPANTFSPDAGAWLARRCEGERRTPVCYRISYYEAMADDLTRCDCAPGEWAAEVMYEAIDRMQEAVDAGGSERSCRMLRRLASR